MSEKPSKLAEVQRKALYWIEAHEPVSAFPCDGTAPSIRFVKNLTAMGLVETAGVEEGRFGYTRFRLTDAGRERLSAHPTLTDEAKASRSKALDELGALDGEMI